jgi:hypothetical protein
LVDCTSAFAELIRTAAFATRDRDYGEIGEC